jgi:hypothetical protein
MTTHRRRNDASGLLGTCHPRGFLFDARRRRTEHRRVKNFTVAALSMVVALGGHLPAAEGPSHLPALTISRETTHILEPLRADGTPDYVAWLDKEYEAKPSDNAAIPLLRVLRMEVPDEVRRAMGAAVAPATGTVWLRGAPRWSELQAHLKPQADAKTGLVPGVGALPEAFDAACSKQWTRAQRAPWAENDAPLIAAWLRANEAALSEVEAAAGRSRFWIPVPRDLSLHTPVPSLLVLRQSVQALRARALLALGRGDVKAAQRDLVTGFRLDSAPRFSRSCSTSAARRLSPRNRPWSLAPTRGTTSPPRE